MFLVESHFNDIIAEQDTATRKLYLSGPMIEAEIKNRNGRIYKRDTVQSAVNKVNEAIKNNTHILGELDHPTQLQVSLQNVSHRIDAMHMVGNQGVGKALILPTPMGNIAKGLIESHVRLGVSTRGSGTVNNDGIVENFDLVTIDIVATPSAPNAFPASIYEQLQLYPRGEQVRLLAEALVQDSSAQKYFEREILKFIQSAATFSKA